MIGDNACSAAIPKPRAAPAPGNCQVKLRAKKSVAAIIVQRSGARFHSRRRSTASTSVECTNANTSSNASRIPRFNPCPATGCSVCAALPIRTVRPSVNVRSAFRPNANDFNGDIATTRPASGCSSVLSTANRCVSSSSVTGSSSRLTHQTSAAWPLFNGNSATGPWRVKRS